MNKMSECTEQNRMEKKSCIIAKKNKHKMYPRYNYWHPSLISDCRTCSNNDASAAGCLLGVVVLLKDPKPSPQT